MKVFNQDRARGKRGVAVGVLAASMLASVLGMAPAAHALPPGYYEVGCGDSVGLAQDIILANNDGGDSVINVKGTNCTFKYSTSFDGFFNGGTGDAALGVDDGTGT